MKKVFTLFVLLSSMFADITENKNYGLFTGENTSYLYNLDEVTRAEVRFIYLGRLKVLRGSVPVKVLLLPLDNYQQEVAIKDLTGLSVDKIGEEIEANSNILIIDNRYYLLTLLKRTIGAISIIDNSLIYNHNGTLVKLKVAQ